MSGIMWTMLKHKERAANDRISDSRHRVGEAILKKGMKSSLIDNCLYCFWLK